MTTEAEPGVIRPQPQDTGNPETGRGRKDAPQSLWSRNLHKPLLKSALPGTLTMAYPQTLGLVNSFFFRYDWHVGSEFPIHRSNHRRCVGSTES